MVWCCAVLKWLGYDDGEGGNIDGGNKIEMKLFEEIPSQLASYLGSFYATAGPRSTSNIAHFVDMPSTKLGRPSKPSKLRQSHT